MAWTMAWPGGKQSAITFSFDDGVRQDIRMIEILNRHGLKGTFNLNSRMLKAPGSEKGDSGKLNSDEVSGLYRAHEVATHGATHAHLPMLDAAQQATEILDDRRLLEELVGYPVGGHAYSFGSYNQEVMAHLGAYGIKYARTTLSTGVFRLPEAWLAWHPTCHHSKMEECLDRALGANKWDCARLFYIWTHTYELVNCWDKIDALCARAVNANIFWAATNMEIYEYTETWRRLMFSTDGIRVRNPTGTALWIMKWWEMDTIMEIPPGSVATLR